MDKLEPGEISCPDCDGSGTQELGGNSEDTFGNKWDLRCPCDKCHGKGKLDWIEQVVGVHDEPWVNVTINREPIYVSKEMIDGDWSYQNEIVQKMSQQLADNIDKQILETMGVPDDETGRR